LLHALLALAGLAGLGVWLAARRGSLSRPRRHFAVIALSATGLVLTLLPLTPYSAGNAMTFRSGLVHWHSMRYLGLLPLLGWGALGLPLDAGAGAPPWRPGAALVIALAALGVSPLPLVPLIVIVGVFVLGTIAIRHLRGADRYAPALGGRAIACVLA